MLSMKQNTVFRKPITTNNFTTRYLFKFMQIVCPHLMWHGTVY